MTDRATLVTVMRHGEVDGPAHVLRGKHDVALTETGWRQMRQTVDAANSPPFSTVASSTLMRCRAFSDRFAAELALPVNLHAGFEEIDFGDWEGLTPSQAQALSPQLFERFQSNPEGTTPPNGEAFSTFRNRVCSAFDDCLPECSGGHALIITHAGVMRVLLAEKLGLPWHSANRIAIPPAGSFQLSLLHGHPPCLLNLNSGQPCAA